MKAQAYSIEIFIEENGITIEFDPYVEESPAEEIIYEVK